MRKKMFAAVLLVFAVFTSKAQEATIASGGDASGIRGSSSYSIGQPVYESTTFNRINVTQGVQHAYEVSELDIQKGISSSLTATVYPNPSTDVVNLQIENNDQEQLAYELVAVSGQLIYSGNISEANTSITMKNYAQGVYFLKVISKEQTIKTFKIIKN